MTDETRSDEWLVRRASTGSDPEEARRAAGELFGRYHRRVYVWCFRVMGDHERALDVAQDAMMSAYRNLSSFRSESRFSSWLFAIARNRCISAMRSTGLERDESIDVDSLAGHADPLDVLTEQMEEEHVLQLVRETLQTDEQTALWLRCFERMPVDEITRLMHLDSASGARGLLQAARRKLRAALSRRQEGTE
jgi:RNA polymerase sigma-70 factor (ECF subfamily)